MIRPYFTRRDVRHRAAGSRPYGKPVPFRDWRQRAGTGARPYDQHSSLTRLG
ncbi:MAG: hypothetical protein KatS3mg050_0357 [Litorilinea sp.]|nr:MAG: hypothetical protein KatS3mg050_0357 [Litorilinea sp.]